MENTNVSIEGWGWLYNSRKWHYFRDGRSLCHNWLGLGLGKLEQGKDDSLDNCKACRGRLIKERLKNKLK
jgi:hypothetical protein